MLTSRVLEPLTEDLELLRVQKKLEELKPLGKNPSPAISKLLTDILMTHCQIEILIEDIVTKKLFSIANPKPRMAKTYSEFSKITKFNLFNGLTWVKKLQIALEIDLITDELELDLRRLNQLRNQFSHTLDQKFRIYENKERQIWAYRLLTNSLVELKIINNSFGF